MSIDKRGQLEENPFSYKVTKDDKLLIYRNHQLIFTLSAKKALKVIGKLERTDNKEEQLILAKITGHYKHGNES